LHKRADRYGELKVNELTTLDVIAAHSARDDYLICGGTYIVTTS
jgi:hypothetical protein